MNIWKGLVNMKYIVSFEDESEIPYLVKCDFTRAELFIGDAELAIKQKMFDYADARLYVILYRCLRATLLLKKNMWFTTTKRPMFIFADCI